MPAGGAPLRHPGRARQVSRAPGANRSVRFVMRVTTTSPSRPCGRAIRPTSSSGRPFPSPPDAGFISSSVDDVDRRLLAVAGRGCADERAQRLGGAAPPPDDPSHVPLGDVQREADAATGLGHLDRNAFGIVHDRAGDVLEHRARRATCHPVAGVVVSGLALGGGRTGDFARLVVIVAVGFLALASLVVLVLVDELVIFVVLELVILELVVLVGEIRVLRLGARRGEGR